MRIELTPEQKSDRAAFRAFADESIAPFADQYDREERMPSDLIQQLAQRGYLGAVLPKDCGGAEMDMIAFGLLNEELGRGCSSLRSLLTVHSMVSTAIKKWGSRYQKEHWLLKLASGAIFAAFGLTEPQVGSDARSIETSATLFEDCFILNGRKRWITGGQIADLFLIFAQCEGKPAAFLVERNQPGLHVSPVSGMYGVRASMLADLRMDECRVAKENLVGRVGFGFSHVASHALDLGRYCVAWGCVGIIRACLEASISYANERKQFGVYLKDHQLIQQMLTDMITNLKASRLLCYQAGYLKESGDPRAITETSIAKYFASTSATRAANDAVQIHGAIGCSSEHSVQRYLRDAKIMEIIEGSTQIQQIAISKYGQQEYWASRDED